MIRSVRVQPHQKCRALALALGIAVLALAFLGHINTVDSHHGPEQACHHHTCWILTPESTLPSVIVLAWFSSVFHFTLLREHGRLVYKPPRLRTLQSIHMRLALPTTDKRCNSGLDTMSVHPCLKVQLSLYLERS
jgi:hypothetical protein